MKKLLIVSLLVVFTSCGYKPLFHQMITFSIIKINYDNSVNSKKIVHNLKRYENTKSTNLYQITFLRLNKEMKYLKIKNDLSNYRIIINSVVK